MSLETLPADPGPARRAKSERAEVEAWRLGQFLEYGFSAEQAERLHVWGVDLAEMRTMRDMGMPVQIAFDYLRPDHVPDEEDGR